MELVVDEVPWTPERIGRHDPQEMVWVRVAYSEQDLRYRVRLHGGVWSSKKRLWQIAWRSVEILDIKARVVDC